MFVELVKSWEGKPIGERIDTAAEQADLLVKAGYAKELKEDPLQRAIQSTIASATEKIGQGMGAAIDAALEKFAKAMGHSRRSSVPSIFGPGGNGDPQKSFPAFLLAVRRGDQKAVESFGSEFIPSEQKAADLNTLAGDEGGYLVPEQFVPQILGHAVEMAVVRPRATDVPMQAKSVEWPALDISSSVSAGDTAMLGGLTAVWTGEGATRTQTEPKFEQVRLQAHELSGYTVASNTLIADSAIGLERMLTMLFGKAIAWYEDYAFLRGDGVGKPLGIIQSAAFKTVTRSAASAFALADAANMYEAFIPGANLRSSAWVMHPFLFGNLITQNMSGTGSPLAWTPDGVRGTPGFTYLGLPVLRSEKLPAPNVPGDVTLADFSFYLAGRRTTGSGSDLVEIAFSPHVKFLTNQGAWRFVRRADGQPWVRSTITLADGTNTVSPFVGLAAG